MVAPIQYGPIHKQMKCKKAKGYSRTPHCAKKKKKKKCYYYITGSQINECRKKKGKKEPPGMVAQYVNPEPFDLCLCCREISESFHRHQSPPSAANVCRSRSAPERKVS